MSDAFQAVHLRAYLRSVQTCSMWFATADELQFSAEQLRPQVDAWWGALEVWGRTPVGERVFPTNGCHSISMMLMAFAFENLCKGAMVRDGLVDVSDATLVRSGLSKTFTVHKLRDLAARVEFNTSDEEEELLSRMTRAAVWRARYPAAVRYHESLHTQELGGKKHSLTWHGASDMERIDALLSRLREHLGVPRNMSSARDAMP